MSKNTSAFNAYQDLNGPGSTNVAPATKAVSVTVTGNAIPIIGASATYKSDVAFTATVGTEDESVIWSVVRVSGTGSASINQKGQVDFSASVVADVYDVVATSRYNSDNFESLIKVVSAPSVDGGRVGDGTGSKSLKAAKVTGKLVVTVQAVP